MKLIGRKLVMDWTSAGSNSLQLISGEKTKTITIEILIDQNIYPPEQSPTPKTPQLFEIYEVLGERVEKYIGPSCSSAKTHGRNMDMLMPGTNTEAWMTEEKSKKGV